MRVPYFIKNSLYILNPFLHKGDKFLKAVKLMIEAYKILLEATDSMRASKLHDTEAFKCLLESLKQLSWALTIMRATGRLDPETEKEVERVLTKLNTPG